MYFTATDMDTGTDELEHYGVQGMKWGIRKYVNYDGSLTSEGKRKYGSQANFQRAQQRKKNIIKGVAIGAGVAAGAAGAYAAYKHYGNRIGVNKIPRGSRIGSAKNFTNRNANTFTRAREYAQRAANAAANAGRQGFNSAKNMAGNAAGAAKAYGERAKRDAGAAFNDARRWADSHMGANYRELRSDRLSGPSMSRGKAAASRIFSSVRGASSKVTGSDAFNRGKNFASQAFSNAKHAAGNAAGAAKAYGERAKRDAGAAFNDARRWADSHVGARYRNVRPSGGLIGPSNKLGGSTVSRGEAVRYYAKRALNSKYTVPVSAAAGAAAGYGAYKAYSKNTKTGRMVESARQRRKKSRR